MLRERKPNWLPIPFLFGEEFVEKVAEPTVDENDRFPKGKIVKFFPQQEYGFIHDQHGRDVYFHLGELDFVGASTKKQIQVGAKIGYDVSWTSHGLHVKRMKIYS